MLRLRVKDQGSKGGGGEEVRGRWLNWGFLVASLLHFLVFVMVYYDYNCCSFLLL